MNMKLFVSATNRKASEIVIDYNGKHIVFYLWIVEWHSWSSRCKSFGCILTNLARDYRRDWYSRF